MNLNIGYKLKVLNTIFGVIWLHLSSFHLFVSSINIQIYKHDIESEGFNNKTVSVQKI